MALVVLHAELPLDQLGHTRKRPELGGKPVGTGSLEQGFFEFLELACIETRGTPQVWGDLQAFNPISLPGVIPPMSAGGRYA